MSTTTTTLPAEPAAESTATVTTDKVDKPQRKGPGRPRKTIETQTVEIRGIVDAPEDPDNFMELVYCNTAMFKDLLKLFSQYNISDIEIAFQPKNIEITAKGPSDKTTHHVTINGHGLNHYYCRETIKSCISIAVLDDILFGGNKNYHKITMIAQENYRSKLKIVLNNLEYSVDEIFDLDVGYRPPDQTSVQHPEQSDADYPVRFTMSKQYFNASMVKMRKFGTEALFQKIGGGGFQIQAVKAGRTMKTDNFRDNKILSMECTLEEGDILSVTVPLDYMIPLAKANIGNQIIVSLSKTKNVSMTTYMAPSPNIGPICCIKIFAEIRT